MTIEPKCRVITSKSAGDSGAELCGKEAKVYFPILADDDVTVLDLLMVCVEHDAKYEEGHTLVVKDLRGHAFMFQKPGLESKQDAGVQSP